jgi:hypothetical protein
LKNLWNWKFEIRNFKFEISDLKFYGNYAVVDIGPSLYGGLEQMVEKR